MICLVGKTASGKDTVLKELVNSGMKTAVSHTTRPMRNGEVDGVTYHFVTAEKFHELESEDYFAETTYYDVATKERWFYGCSKKELFEDSFNKVVILNPHGIETLFNKLSLMKLTTWFIVHLDCSEDIIKERLVKRGDNPDEANRRIVADNKDFENVNKYVNLTICNDGSKTPKELSKIIVDAYDRFLFEV